MHAVFNLLLSFLLSVQYSTRTVAMPPRTYDLSVPLARNPVIAVTVFGALATLTTFLRLWALRMRKLKPGLPEYMIIGALVSLGGEASTSSRYSMLSSFTVHRVY